MRLLQHHADIMKRKIVVRLPKPLVFVVTLLLLILTFIAVNNYIEANPIAVFGGGQNANATLEDLAEKIYTDVQP